MRKFAILALCIAAAYPAAWAYVRWTTQAGIPLKRTDFTNVPFSINSRTAAGLTNSAGGVIISADSDPVTALRASAGTWSRNPSTAVRFAELDVTDAADSSGDRRNVIVFTDTPEHRSVVGGPNGAIAVTLITYNPSSGEILDSDIVFNPEIELSTTLEAGTYDIRSTATHELGHALGAGHTNIIWATMFFTGPAGTNVKATLSPDETAFLAEVYPARGVQNEFGILSGRVTAPGGSPVRGAFVTALNRSTAVHVSAISNATDGTYTMYGVPPGDYVVYAEPVDGPVFPENVPLASADANFVTTALGGFSSPSTVRIPGGGRVTAEIQVIGGSSSVNIIRAGTGRPGSSGDAVYSSYGRTLIGGQARDLILWGPGVDASTVRIELLGPGLSIRPGTVRIDSELPTVEGNPAVRMTLDVAGRSQRDLATVLVTRGTDAVTHTGGLAILPGGDVAPQFTAAGIVNSASYTGGRFAPEAWSDLFGQNLATRFLVDGALPASIDGSSISVTDSRGTARAARLHFVSPERIQFLMPAGMSTGAATLQVTNATGASASASIEIARVAPAMFAANANGQGPAAATFLRVAAGGARTEDFTFTLDAPPNRTNVPVDLGSSTDQIYLSFFGTGFRNNTSVSCAMSGVRVPVAAAVAQGQFAGLDQAVAGPLPRTLAGRRDLAVIFTFNGVQTNTVTLSFR